MSNAPPPPNVAIDDDPSDDVFAAFISHASPDRERAHEIVRTLEARGLRCWIAPRDVRPGHEYGAEIIHGIGRARCIVLVLSEAANGSTFVQREVVTAVNRQKPVFPIRVEDVLPSPALELYVSSTHWIDAWSGALAEHVRRLAEDLADERVMAEGRERSRRIARRRRRLPRWLAAGAAFCAIAVAVVVVNQLTRTTTSSGPGGGGATPATNPFVEVLDDGPGGMYAAYRRRVSELGIDFDRITRDDFTFEVRDEPSRTFRPKLHIKTSPKLVKILEMFTGTIAFDGGEPKTFSTAFMSPYVRDEADIANARSLTLSFASQWQRTGEDRTIGPFTYDVNLESAIRTLWRARALADAKRWVRTSKIRAGDKRVQPWEFWQIKEYLPGIKRVRAGTSPDALDVMIEIKDASPDYPDDLETDELERAYDRARVPVPDAAQTIYLQVEFFDGTKSELQRYDRVE